MDICNFREANDMWYIRRFDRIKILLVVIGFSWELIQWYMFNSVLVISPRLKRNLKQNNYIIGHAILLCMKAFSRIFDHTKKMWVIQFKLNPIHYELDYWKLCRKIVGNLCRWKNSSYDRDDLDKNSMTCSRFLSLKNLYPWQSYVIWYLTLYRVRKNLVRFS